MSWTLTEAGNLCARLERRLRPIGWHVGLTGSVLYGLGKSATPSDLDLILYPNNDEAAHEEQPAELMQALGIRQYRFRDNDEYDRDVIKTTTKDGRAVDFLILR